MEAQVRTILERQFETPVRRVVPLGGGFYGRAFLAEIGKDPHILVLKLYLFPNLAAQEALQLKTLARHATVKMPAIYFVREAADAGERDALAMEYLPGLNAGKLADLAGLPVETLAEEMIDNLAAYHETVHAAGFGPLDAEAFVPDWRMYYEPMWRLPIVYFKQFPLVFRGEGLRLPQNRSKLKTSSGKRGVWNGCKSATRPEGTARRRCGRGRSRRGAGRVRPAVSERPDPELQRL